jgi:Zn-dependent peptidase ImmA (M78 family)/predicted secreted protein
VITWADAHRRAAAKAAEVRADLDISQDHPVDVFHAIQRLGLVLAFAPLGRVSGLYIPRRDSGGILLHSGHPRTRQRYTAGHELGHHVFGHAAEVDLDLEGALQRDDVERWPDHEKEAEAFGAWFLMPRRLMLAGLRQLGIDVPQNPYHIYSLALWLGTSYTATTRQLSATRIISYSQAEIWSHIPPRTVKRALAGDLAPDDLQNDVWWLDGRHNYQPVEARPGDRLVLTLSETASSGFSWRFTELPDDLRLLADSYEDEWEPEATAHEPEDEEDLVGRGHPRSFVIEIDREARRRVQRLALVKDQPWEPSSSSEEFELLVSINPRLSGLQMSERELVLTG